MTLETKCQKHWERIGINDTETLKGHIRALFDRHDHQQKVLIDLYRMVLPDWEQIKKIQGYPEAGDSLWKFICRCFQEFDGKNHPSVLPGGAWMNSGFSVNKDLPGWEVSFQNCSLVFKD